MQPGQQRLGLGVAGLGAAPQPAGRDRRVLRHPGAGQIELPEPGLRPAHALLGRPGKPVGGLGRIALDPVAVEVENREVELGRDMSLLGRPARTSAPRRRSAAARPRRGRASAPSANCASASPMSAAARYHIAASLWPLQAGKLQHRRRIAALRRLPQIGFGHDPVLRHAVALQEVQREMVARPRVAALGRQLEQGGGPRRVARQDPVRHRTSGPARPARRNCPWRRLSRTTRLRRSGRLSTPKPLA